MAKGLSGRVRVAATCIALALAVVLATPAQATFAESANDALARNVKLLGSSPRDFDALVGAGRAALALGDTQTAAGFFGRAEEVWPASPLPQAGMGAALAQDGDPRGALSYFDRAMQRGATQSMIGADRGLAYDLLGRHAQAQADYRAAMLGRDGDEARRRLAMSLAISGEKAEALSTLGPLMARGDAAGARCRAFVLALTGDSAGARSAIEAAMPGSSREMDYFFRKLPTLRSDQKVAAVNLGVFPGAPTVTPYNAPAPMQVLYGRNEDPADDRMRSIEEWLKQGKAATAEAPADVTPSPAPAATQVASVSLPPAITQPARARGDASPAVGQRKLWLQLASGPNPAALPGEFDKMKRRNEDLFEGISGYVAQDGGRARLVIGPFRNEREASIFMEDLASVRINAFTWTSQPGQTVRKLSSE